MLHSSAKQRIKPVNRFIHQPDPRLDLVFERIVDISSELIWTAWTTPEHLKQWFTPKPWETVDCEIDLRPGGIFRTVLRSPEGQEFPNLGCYLEIIPKERLIWTNALQPGFRPAKLELSENSNAFTFTAILSLETHGNGTKYRATVIHADGEDCKKHNDMGFQDGWSKALDQLVAHMKKI
jgi:uncharacterized protein YndB with AHSA1/START domain